MVVSEGFYRNRPMRLFEGDPDLPEKTVVAMGQEMWGWPPKVMTRTFGVLERKLESYRKQGMPVQQLLAVIDYWIGRLFDLRARIGGRYPLYGPRSGNR